MGTAHLLLPRFKKAAASSSGRLFSYSAALIRRPWTQLTDKPEDSDGESVVYRRALKLQRPTTVKHWECEHNSVSLIGTIESPLIAFNAPNFGVYTRLKVKSSTAAYRHLCVKINFWDEMAEMSVQHLKPNDFIYVSGHLGSGRKVDEHGKSMHYYEVDVKEINFVAQHGPGSSCQQKVSFEDIMQKRRDRLHSWHVFFANPHEWWDNRNSKLNPKYPDFKHKDTGEVLWLSDSDPAWIKQQLQLLDSRSNKQGPREHRNTLSHLSPLVYDDAQET